MIVGCGEWGFRELPMRQHFEICQRIGFRWIEFGIGGGQIGRLPESAGPEVDEFLAMCQDFEVSAPFCCLENDFTLPSQDAHDHMVQVVLKNIELAKTCGATHVRLFAGFTPVSEMSESIWARMLDAFARCDRLCESLDMVIAVETHGRLEFTPGGAARHIHTVTTERDALQRLLRELPPRIGFNYDPGNLKPLRDGDESLRLDLLNERINYCHLKDWRRQGNGWVACAVGDDDLDYGPILSTMTYDGVFLIEYEPLHDPEDGLLRSLQYLRNVVDRVDFV